MTFHDERLPEDVERGASGGPQFKTTILVLDSGFEQRNIDWSRTRGSWDISYGIDSKQNQQDVIDFFYARQGRANSFRFKDWTDYEIGSTGTPQEIAVADGIVTQFQIFRRYVSGSYTYSRAITLPVATPEVYVDGVLQVSGVAVDLVTGVITFDVAPLDTLSVGVVGEFDVPVRFDTDEMNMIAFLETALQIPEMRIVEVRVALEAI